MLTQFKGKEKRWNSKDKVKSAGVKRKERKMKTGMTNKEERKDKDTTERMSKQKK